MLLLIEHLKDLSNKIFCRVRPFLRQRLRVCVRAPACVSLVVLSAEDSHVFPQ